MRSVVGTGASTICVALALAACSPALDSLRARRDKLEAIIPSSASSAASCIGDAATRSGATIEKTNYDAELAVSEVVLTFAATDGSGPAFDAWYELTPRDGKNARVVYSFDAQDPHREAAGALVLGPIMACSGDANR